ncbi:TRAP transporter small permease [Silicimonas algicola]|uniref:TRAP transporter small permease protein n=1 Tax=Silicimonas algicola TaxID=1826607 RepID=A0A316G1Q0_9RHOB|nr:TRAP transporter small permease [Silicimonas algicola]AZQ65878.1 TRAP transporter small permease [Silicimonas algicola]PWK54738.1 TRAP-type C4-dicarboxylate transport system permease small subunit [Silicimonas algicola]
MTVLRRAADALTRLAATIGALALLVEVGVILVDVIGRAFGHPLFGSQDLVTMTMVILVFGGMTLCDRNGGHIAVDLLEPRFSPTLNRVIDVASAILGAVIFVFIAWAVWESAKLSQMLNLSTNLLRLPKAWFQWALIAFVLLAAVGMALRAAELALRRHDVRKEPL